ncbi:hypothetical protein ES708_14019 [subsurface metagenome]
MTPVEDITFLSEFTPIVENRPLYEGLWENWKKCGFILFHEEIVGEIERFFYDPKYSSKDFNYPFISTFVFYLNEFYDVDKAFLEAGGLKTRYGIIWIRYKIQDFYNKHKKIPKSKNLKFISSYLDSTDYSKYGYSSWERLIFKNLTEPVLKERWKGFFGLQEAKRRVIYFYTLHGKPPNAHQFPVLSKCCQKGSWKQQGITDWRDFLSYVLGKKLKTYYKKTWSGALGLHRARILLYKYIAIHDSIPEREKFHSAVQECLKEGRWEPLGIYSWIDLLWTIHAYTSKQILDHINYSRRRYNKTSWKGLDGLTNAMVDLSDYHTQYKKFPIPKNFPTIARMCGNRRWKRWGISSWEDLFQAVFDTRKN